MLLLIINKFSSIGKKDNKFERDTYSLFSNMCRALTHSFEGIINSIDEKEDYPDVQREQLNTQR